MSYGSEAAALNALLSIFAGFWLIILAFFVLNIVAGWKIFEKAGQPGWASIVPFYNSYIRYKIFWGNGWLFFVPIVCTVLGGIPLLGTLLVIVGVIINIVTLYKQSVAFGQGIGFTIGLFFLNPIFNMILAFGQYRYFGIPQDGYSYDQMKQKYDTYKAAHPAQAQPQYQQPTQEQTQNPNMTYQAPAQPKQPATPVQPQQPAAPQQPTENQGQ